MSRRAVFPLLGSGEAPTREPDETSRPLIEHAYRQLRDDIVEGCLAPGEKLRAEHLRGHYGQI